MPYSWMSFRMTFNDLEWLSDMFNCMKHRAASLQPLDVFCYKLNIVNTFHSYLSISRMSITVPALSETDIRIPHENWIWHARNCMKSLDHNICRSPIRLKTKIRVYNVCILPILLYGANKWCATSLSSRRFDSFDQWCLHPILRLPYVADATDQRRSKAQNQPVNRQSLLL